MAGTLAERDSACPVRRGLALFEGKWRTRVLYELIECGKPLRFGELARSIPGISKTMLASTLKDLEAMGLVERRQYEEVPLRVEYSLTEAGSAAASLFDAIGDWGKRYLQ